MPVIVGIGMMFMQICTGINTIIYYTATIFRPPVSPTRWELFTPPSASAW